MHAFVAFAIEDAARGELLFHRPIPGFTPSPAAYADAETVLSRAVAVLHAAGVERADDVDCFVAMIAGLVDAQSSNDPGGDRWTAPSRPTDRPLPRRCPTKGKEDPMSQQRIQRPEAKVIAEEEFRRFAELTASLSDDEWNLPTDCTAWDVRKMVLHVLGSGDAQASFPQFVHQLVRGVPLNRQIDSHHWVDGMNELQIRERAHLSNDEVVGQLEAVGPKAVAGRWKTPA